MSRLSRLAALATLAVVAQPLTAQEPEPIPAGRAPAPGAYAPGVNALHYEVEVGLGLNADWFEAKVEILVALTESNPTLPLDLTGLEVLSVTVQGAEARFSYDAGVIRVPLAGYDQGDEVRVGVHYRGTPDDGLILRENVHGARSAFVDNWPNRTRFWLPTIDHPADKATVRYSVYAPEEWTVIANGHQTVEPFYSGPGMIGPDEGRRLTWTWQVFVPISTYNMVIGAADLEVRSVGTAACGQAPASIRADGCVDVTYWVYPEDVERAEPSFRRAAEMVDYFTELIGPFPYEKMANVQSATRFGGMENASAIFYSEQAIASGRNIEGTVSHEIAHQWFGDAVTEASWHHLWLSEGFATYFGAQFFEAADGVEDFRRRMEQSRQAVIGSEASNRPVVDPAETDLFALLNSNNYPKGGWVLHMLRGLIGDDAFFAGIREYYARHLHSAVLTEDFRAVMEEASGRDLGWFFQQWIYEPGFPELEVEWVRNGDALEVEIRQLQSESWPTFRTPLDVVVDVDGRQERRRIEIGDRTTVVRFDGVESDPRSVVLDPDGWLLKQVRSR